MPKPASGNGRYMPGLDGLRAIAVMAVVAYHLNVGFAPGGLLGVGVFFVLSGYLITDILLAQWWQTGAFQLSQFWFRRARRLLPAFLVMLAFVVLWIVLFHAGQFSSIRGDSISALLYVSNWWFIFHQVSYFARFGSPTPLGHLWSLAVEEQFYVIWPFILLLGMRFVRRRGRLICLTLLLAAASASAMALLYHPGTDPSRVYYGTDTRAFSLLIGASLAMIWPSRKLSVTTSVSFRRLLDVTGGVGLVVVLLMIWQTNEYQSFLYRGGLVILSFATALVIASVAHPATYLSKILAIGPLRWLGTRSYGIYLWHYPVIILTSPSVNTVGINVSRALIQVAVSIALAELSWRLVEEPIRHGGLRRLWREIHLRSREHPRFSRILWVSSGTLGAAAMFVGATGVVPTATAKSSSDHVVLHRSSPSSVSSVYGTGDGTSSHSEEPVDTVHQNSAKEISQKPKATVKTLVTMNSNSTEHVSAIGDSVMVDATPYLKQLIPGIVADGQVGRQMIQALSTVAQLKSQGQLGDDVIIELGTNGPFTKNQLVSLLQSLGPVQHIILVNTRVPRPWQDVVNATLAQVAATFPNTTLVNWYAASAGQNSFFYPDGVHLNPTGAKFYATLLDKAVEALNQPNKTNQ